ncbi:MAG TPA: SIMPL domain-containing protein [Methylomirabilota bacterium]|nr:SIMPL domain-containing protein [Methylomirabilota bacterium]
MAIDDNRRGSALPALIVGLCLLLGLAIAGYLVGRGAMRFRSDTRVVTVKGLVEREVKADRAVWALGLRRASETVADAHARISADRDAVLAFLKKQGFTDAEIERQPTRTVDKLAREYGQPQPSDRLRYVVTTSVVVRTANVERVRTSVGSTEELLKAGVLLDGERQGGGANPRYVVSTFNDLRPQLLADATRNARATAQQFAADSGAQVGSIRSANQGSIQIFGQDGGDESAPFSPTSTPVKRIRVVSTFEFELR